MKRITSINSKDFLPQLSVDVVIMGYQDGAIKCLLLRIKDKWLLPGGYVEQKQSVEEAAESVLELRTGLKGQHLKFLAVFGSADRDFKKEREAFLENPALKSIEIDDPDFFSRRYVTLSYYALVDIDKIHPELSFLDEEWQWFDVSKLPDMWMDHKDIVMTARERLKDDIRQEHITHNLLPEQFTMPALHQLHQVILETPIDRSRFQKTMLATDKFERLPKLKKDSPGRSPYLYRVKP